MKFKRRQSSPETPNVPKLAATLASLLLIASSIGVNIVRYPQVGRMIDPGRAEAAEAASQPPVASPSPGAETASAEPSAAKPEGDTPPAEVRQETAAGTSMPNERKFPDAATPPPQADLAVPITDVRPMVPVASLQANGDSTPSRSEIRRLPPVENTGLVSAGADDNPADAGMAYPTTSTP